MCAYGVTLYYYAAVLTGRITSIARPSVRPSVCPVWSPASSGPKVEKIGRTGKKKRHWF